jgi:REP element-mobilizing transposase RayT
MEPPGNRGRGRRAGDEMLMRPDPDCVIRIALALAAVSKRYARIRILAFCFVSNHFHLILGIDCDEDALDISDFMKDLDQDLAESINALRDRDGHFVKGRPKITPILDEDHLAERMAYTHTQPVHHHLVERVEEWPGLSSFRAVCEGSGRVVVHHLDEAAWREAGAEQSELAAHTTTVTIPIAMPASWESMSPRAVREARRAHEERVRARERVAALERRASGKQRRLPKPSHYTRVDPFSRPSEETRAQAKAKGAKPWAYGTAEAVQAYCEAYDAMLASYRVASARFRATGKLCAFPEGTRPPWIARAPVS